MTMNKTARISLLVASSILAFLLVDATSAQAANHYVRAGAKGINNGSDWTNAFTSLPATLVRGDSYYIAIGAYGSYTFDDPVSGGQYITIKKATILDHGTDVGWSDSYSTGQATFENLVFSTSYWVFDGVTGGGPGSWETGLGFKISGSYHLIELSGNLTNITISHVEATNPAGANVGTETDVFYALGSVSNILINRNYWHDVSGVGFLTRNSQGITYEYSKFKYNGDSSNQFTVGGIIHKEFWSLSADSNAIIRYNIFEDVSNTAFIANVNGSGTSNNWQIYGNVFVHTGTRLSSVSALMDLGYSSSMTISNWKFYNNSVININPGGGGQAGIIMTGTNGGGNVAYNNLFYHNNANALVLGGFTTDYSFYSDNRRIEGCNPTCNIDNQNKETHAQISTGSPFVSWTKGDYELLTPTKGGYALTAPYNTDPLDNVRGADGVWDRGTYEFKNGILPRPPDGVKVK